jgi:hypothetical protein
VSEPARTDELHGEIDPLRVGAAGLVAFLLGVVLGSRLLRLLGFAGVAAAGVLYSRRRMAERRKKIDAAERQVRSALDDLDPVARVQVLKDAAKDSF